jgi:hypothetical protein
MSPLAAPLATFLFFSGFAAAQIYAPLCTVAPALALNSLGQNPCEVAARLEATCHDGSFTINALGLGYEYLGPSSTDASDLCQCNTVTYSLMSACGACQGRFWISWSDYSSNCAKTLPPSSFPNPIPSGTRVPQWALIDITSENLWDLDKAIAVGDSPEQTPGTRLGTQKSSSNTGIIVGSAVGGVAVISFVIAIVFFLRRRRREAPALVASRAAGESQEPLTMGNGYTASSTPVTIGLSPMPGTPITPMRNVRVSCPISSRASMCAHRMRFLAHPFF